VRGDDVPDDVQPEPHVPPAAAAVGREADALPRAPYLRRWSGRISGRSVRSSSQEINWLRRSLPSLAGEHRSAG
jgi:hypothetical protein